MGANSVRANSPWGETGIIPGMHLELRSFSLVITPTCILANAS